MAWVEESLRLVRAKPGTVVERGLSAAELDNVQRIVGFRWPPDLCELLAAGLPTGDRWPNWRALHQTNSLEATDDSVIAIRNAMGWPLEGLLFDIDHNSFWDPQWGARPTGGEAARTIATEALRLAPALVPIYAHRYLPASPCEAGNPVLSVYQMDIIIYGRDLASYFENECGKWDPARQEPTRVIPYWTRWMLAEWEWE